MAYFNHAFYKSFLATSVDTVGGTKTKDLTPGELALVDGSTWTSVASVTVPSMVYFVQGSFHTSDKIGNNPGHGGYTESVKSKGINPRFVTRIWQSACCDATPSTVSVSLASDCAPCGETLFLRLDVKGSPALRFLNRNSYAIGDSGSTCCVEGQTYLDPVLVIATIGQMLLADPLIAPFVAEGLGGGIVATVAGVPTTYTIAQALDGTYVPSTDPVADEVTATLNLQGAYVDTKFGNCSFDTRDFYEKEPVQLIASMLDETGNPCNNCGVVTTTPGTMQQTSGETVLREIILTEAYMQSPYNQGNLDSARIREIEGSNDILNAVDRNALYKTYYIQHSIPRLNNPTGVFDNDQYVYQIFVKCDDTGSQSAVEALLAELVTAAGSSGNPIAIEESIDSCLSLG